MKTKTQAIVWDDCVILRGKPGKIVRLLIEGLKHELEGNRQRKSEDHRETKFPDTMDAWECALANSLYASVKAGVIVDGSTSPLPKVRVDQFKLSCPKFRRMN